MKVPKISPQAGALYLSGLSIEDVARELHVSYRTARKAIQMAGVPLRDPSARLVGRTRPDKQQFHPVDPVAPAASPALPVRGPDGRWLDSSADKGCTSKGDTWT